jgi:hypothetical protein
MITGRSFPASKIVTTAVLMLAAMPAWGHRLDEYLQASIVTIAKNRVEVEMTLTPGVAVYRALITTIDTNADGVVSEAEEHAYADAVLRDLSWSIDGHRLSPRWTSIRFPSTDEMKEGQGEIQIDVRADLPPGGRTRALTFENHHQPRISIYQVNSLVPADPHLRIAAQDRNYSQSHYRLDYEQTDVSTGRPSFAWLGLILIAPLALLLRQRAQTR